MGLMKQMGSFFRALRLHEGDRLLIRGGSTSVGMVAAAIAKRHGEHVTSTTHRAERTALLHEAGADEVLIDDGAIADRSQSHMRAGNRSMNVISLVGYI